MISTIGNYLVWLIYRMSWKFNYALVPTEVMKYLIQLLLFLFD